MSDYEQLIEEISDVCQKNQELLEIVKKIAEMESTKRYEFRKSIFSERYIAEKIKKVLRNILKKKIIKIIFVC